MDQDAHPLWDPVADRHALATLRYARAVTDLVTAGHDLDEDALQWLSHSISLLCRKCPNLLGGRKHPLIARPAGPVLSVQGWIQHAPLAAALVDWAVQTTRHPLATELAALLLNLALGPVGMPNLHANQQLLLEAGRALRHISRGEIKVCLNTEADLAEPDILALLRTFVGNEPPQGDLNGQGTGELAQRYVGSLLAVLEGRVHTEIAASPSEVVTYVPSQVGPREQTPDQVDANWSARLPAQHVSQVAEVDGTDDDIYEIPRVLAAAAAANRKGARPAMDALELRAARARNAVPYVGRLDALTPQAINDLGTLIEEQAQDNAAHGGCAALILSIYCGVPLSALPNWDVLLAGAKAPQGQWALRAHPLAICVPSAVIDGWLPDIPEGFRTSERPQSHHVYIPFPTSAFGVNELRAWLKQWSPGTPLFSSLDLHCARELLVNRRASHDNPATPRRLPQALARALNEIQAGIAESSFLRGRLPSHSSAAPVSYYAPRLPEIARVGVQAIERISSWLGGAPVLEMTMDLPEDYVGAPRCPTENELAAAIAKLHELAARLPRGRPTLRSQAAYHHRVQILLFQGACLLLGVRPSVHVLDALITPHLVLIDEKAKPGATAYSAARLPPVPDQLAGWLGRWEKHRQWITKAAGLTGDTPAFFMIDVHGQQRWHPAGLKDLTPADWPIVDNGGRHAWRTGTAASGLPGLLAERALGHWGLGGEPGMSGSFSEPSDRSNHWLAADWYTRKLELPDPFGGRYE